MPFDSEKQRRFMYAWHPEIARRWAAEERVARRHGGLVGKEWAPPDFERDGASPPSGVRKYRKPRQEPAAGPLWDAAEKRVRKTKEKR